MLLSQLQVRILPLDLPTSASTRNNCFKDAGVYHSRDDDFRELYDYNGH